MGDEHPEVMKGKSKKRPRGRPRINPAATQQAINIRLDKPRIDKARRLDPTGHRTVSGFVRHAIDKAKEPKA
jgi:hypothetical protein